MGWSVVGVVGGLLDRLVGVLGVGLVGFDWGWLVGWLAGWLVCWK